ncbi:hypothetical protein ACTFIZ_001296 [Dictyostelium cf. discoideum]
MNIKSFLIISIISFFYFLTSLASLTDFSPNIGRDLALPEDIPRAAIITFDQTYLLANSRNSLNETYIFEITLGKYYLNSITSLSANDLFGSLSHYNSFISLFNGINNCSKTVFNQLVVIINILGEFSNSDPWKFNTIDNLVFPLKTEIAQLENDSKSLNNLIKNSISTLSTNIPNVETYTVVINNYIFVSNTLTKTNEILNRVKSYLEIVNNNIVNAKTLTENYESYFDDSTYLSGMNVQFKSVLMQSNLIYNDLFLFSLLADYF